MFRFYRTLRQRLLAENRGSKYLLYALGEIALVIIGILIALQVNNWNAERLEQIKSRNYLEKLHGEMQSMISVYNHQKLDAQKRLEEALEALKFVESCGEAKEYEASFSETLLSHQTLMKFREIRNTYDEMIAAGAFSSVSDDDVKGTIFMAFNVLTAGQSQIDYFRDEVGRASAIINAHVSFSYDANRALTVAYDVPRICSNATFRNALVEIIDAREDWIVGLGFITTSMEEARDAIEAMDQPAK